MRYIEKTKYDTLKKRYEYIVGWGTSLVEFERQYRPDRYKLDCMVNGAGCSIGETICGCIIEAPDAVKRFAESKVCVVVYPNIENVIFPQIKEYLPGADTIVGRLVDCGQESNYSSDVEDLILVELLQKLNISNPFYVDMGVCHPVIRNNTYLLYEKGFHDGLLIEANPTLGDMIREYRKNNVLLNIGVTYGVDAELKYLLNHSQPGLNHFIQGNETDLKGDIIHVPVKNVNDILDEYAMRDIDVLDIDVEGMDYDILETIDFAKHPTKIICAEYGYKGLKGMREMMQERGFLHYTSTRENHIYVAKDVMDKLLSC